MRILVFGIGRKQSKTSARSQYACAAETKILGNQIIAWRHKGRTTKNRHLHQGIKVGNMRAVADDAMHSNMSLVQYR